MLVYEVLYNFLAATSEKIYYANQKFERHCHFRTPKIIKSDKAHKDYNFLND